MDLAVLSCTCITARSQSSMRPSNGSLYQLGVYLLFSSVSAAPSPKSDISDHIHSFARHVDAVVLSYVYSKNKLIIVNFHY